MRGAELSLEHSFSMENATQRRFFGKIFLRLAPGGARGDSFVRCPVKVIRLFRNFTPLRAPGRSADLPAEVVRQRLEQLEARVSERDVLSLYAAH